MVDPDIQRTLNTDFFVTIPLKAKDKVLGAILVDNIFNKKPITKSSVKMLTMFANHAALAIENSRLATSRAPTRPVVAVHRPRD